MTEILESADLVDPWIYTTLLEDSVIQSLVADRIINTQSSDEVAAPYIVFDAASTRAVRGVGGVLLDSDSLYNIKAVSRSGSFNESGTIAARIRYLLDRKNITTAPPTTPVPASIASYWDVEIRYPELHEGAWYRHLGASYRIRATVL